MIISKQLILYINIFSDILKSKYVLDSFKEKKIVQLILFMNHTKLKGKHLLRKFILETNALSLNLTIRSDLK